MQTTMLPLRLAREDEEGIRFIDELAARCGAPAKTDGMRAFIQQWNRLRQELRRVDRSRTDATVEEYAKRWSEPVPAVLGLQAEYRALFGEPTPALLLDLLRDGIALDDARSLKPLLGVRLAGSPEELAT